MFKGGPAIVRYYSLSNLINYTCKSQTIFFCHTRLIWVCSYIQRSALPVLFAFLRALYKDLSYFIYLGFPLRDLKVNL